MAEEKKPVVTNVMLVFALVSPFLFSVGGMIIVLFATQNSPSNVRSIALIIVTFLGLFIAIGSIFLIQRRIKRKLVKNENSSS
jgi:nitrate reductase gamma subunit